MPADIPAIVQRLVPNANYGSADGTTPAAQYASLVRTWRDARPVPTLTAVNAARAAADTDQAAIEADPTVEELFVALLSANSGAPAVAALLTRRTAAEAARTRSQIPPRQLRSR